MIIQQLSSSLGRKDEQPNIDLAIQICKDENSASVSELVFLTRGKNKNLQNDSIKVLYEIGERNSSLILPHLSIFLNHLFSKNNRLQWGAMTAIRMISNNYPSEIADFIFELEAAAASGSVICRDNFIGILENLLLLEIWYDQAFTILIQQLESCPENQLAMYAEMTMSKINDRSRKSYCYTLRNRLVNIEKESKRKRILNVLKSLENESSTLTSE